ncbi:hypothetical protein PPL_12066 [Heterostelium album PN500]|uniref:Ankyrin repeat protein n=1 Tax=Heterostelium pallidum (strain ATCC 26659 / Pp 5 / PN500) TaxID=670386 RepID=D3BLL3_HETP5|nr:hypothetical protein PPL_12066 [Heterostelium album PN500]EFA77464.1 hypothetical protein PPL_12066 [Heterostelium album PN500]|eukprot:XP_020429592.1 hypothetical protein PPL_12066 [Heterostelium album PN500]
MTFAASQGNIECLQWLHANRTEEFAEETIAYAAKNGHFECVKWLHENRSEAVSQQEMEYAAESGHFAIMKWLHENRNSGFSVNMLYGAVEGSYEIFKWLYEHTIKETDVDTVYLVDMAAEYQKLDILKFLLHQNNGVYGGDGYDLLLKAIQKGDLKMLEYLNECILFLQFDEDLLATAASKGYTDIVEYILRNSTGLEINDAIASTIINNHLDTLKYLFKQITSNNSEADRNYMELAVQHDNMDVLLWLYDNASSEYGEISSSFLNIAINNGNVSLVKWIIDHIDDKQMKSLKESNEFNNMISNTLFQYNEFEIIQFILETFKETVTKSKLESYKQLLESKYPNSIESIEIKLKMSKSIFVFDILLAIIGNSICLAEEYYRQKKSSDYADSITFEVPS